ncbi:MAG TPA: DUF308 domain-containing protein [Rhizomicrobium sp.]|jgi:uncharacterized membrane protein HdeD (DUF308 family)
MTHSIEGRADMQNALHAHWRLFAFEGFVLLGLGTAAILVPALASLAVAVFLGWIFLAAGFFGIVMSVAGRQAPGFWWSLVSAIVSLVAGGALIGWPVAGSMSLTFVLTAFLIADGVLTILFALEHRRQLSQRWVWLLINGVLDLLLAALIVLALPASALWALGIIVGIDLIFAGWSLIAMAMAARKSATA